MKTLNESEMNELRWKVARAISAADGNRYLDRLSISYQQLYFKMATAAIEAMPSLYVNEQAVISVGLLANEKKVKIS